MEEKADVSKVHKSEGAYRFRIEGYSGLSQKVGDSVESPEFNICGHTWQLRLFPGGSLEAHKGYISYYLASKSVSLARASYKLMVINQVATGEDEKFSSSGIRIFEPKGIQVDGWGRDKFMTVNTLQDSELGFLVDDAVNFRVEITVFGDLETAPSNSTTAPKSPPMRCHALDMCLEKILQDDVGCDVTLVVGEEAERISSHKALLMARSPVFRAMFSCGMVESSSSEVRIPDAIPSVLREMLHFMYTDRCSSTSPCEVLVDSAIPLLCVALKYQVCGLVNLCEEYLAEQLADDTALSLLQLADMYGAAELKHQALLFISQRSPQLTASPQYRELDEELQRETSIVVEAATRRKGLRSRSGDSSSKDGRRLAGICTIM